MKRLILVSVFVVAVLALSACAGSATPSTSPAVRGASTLSVPSACLEAFEAAAGVDAMADTVSDLYPAVAACASANEWAAAFGAVDGAGFTGTADEVLSNVCFAPEVSALPLCREAGPGSTQENQLEERGPGLTIKAGDSGAADLQGGTYRIAWDASGCTMFELEWAPADGEPITIETGMLAAQQMIDLPAGPGVLNRVADCEYTIRFEAAS